MSKFILFLASDKILIERKLKKTNKNIKFYFRCF